MTCIIAYTDDTHDWIAGDRCFGLGYMRGTSAETKVWQVGSRLFGISGRSQSLCYFRERSKNGGGGDLLELATNSMRDAADQKPDGLVAMVVENGVITVIGEGRVMPISETSWGIGNGAEVALGAFRVAIKHMGTENALMAALEQAESLCDGVGGPFDVLSIERSKAR